MYLKGSDVLISVYFKGNTIIDNVNPLSFSLTNKTIDPEFKIGSRKYEAYLETTLTAQIPFDQDLSDINFEQFELLVKMGEYEPEPYECTELRVINHTLEGTEILIRGGTSTPRIK